MNARAVFFVLGSLLLILAACLLLPLGAALIAPYETEYSQHDVLAFVVPTGLCLVIGTIARWRYRAYAKQVGIREGFAIVALSWLLMTAVGLLPYLITGAAHNLTDAFFETISGFTTTGATTFPQVEVLPPGVQFWRHMTQWLGGMGIVVLSVALLPMLGIGGFRLLKAEAPGGVAYERERPRITDAAKELWLLYLGLSIFLMFIYLLLGMDWFDAVCHAFTTMSSGGFSTHSASAAFFGPAVQWVMIVFMFIAGTNFALTAHLLRGAPKRLFGNPEWRLYVGIIFTYTVLGIFLVERPGNLEAHVRGVLFQVVAVLTTTGYATEDFDAWPQLMRFLILGIMLVGGCMGATSGGMKVARLLVLMKVPLTEMRRLILPHSVQPLRVGTKVIEPNMVANILAFGMVFFACFGAGTLVMAAYGYDLATSASAAASAIGNIGPGLGELGPMTNWSHLPDGAKWAMGFLMLLGRLELFSVLLLFTPWLWRR